MPMAPEPARSWGLKRMTFPFPWPKWTDRLKVLAAGESNANAIAAALTKESGFFANKNMVIGKLTRLRLWPTPASAARQAGTPESRAAIAKKGKPEPRKADVHLAPGAMFGTQKPLAPDPQPIRKEAFAFTDGVTLPGIEFDQCRWPNDGSIWDGTFRFCGQKASSRPWGQSACPYCDEHADRAMSKRAA